MAISASSLDMDYEGGGLIGSELMYNKCLCLRSQSSSSLDNMNLPIFPLFTS